VPGGPAVVSRAAGGYNQPPQLPGHPRGPAKPAPSRLLVVGLVTLGLLGGPPALTAQQPAALLHIPQNSDKDSKPDYRTYRNTQAVFVTTRLAVNAALRRPGVADLGIVKAQADPVAWLQGGLRTDFPHDGEVLRITLPGVNPKEAAVLLNAVAESYLEEFALKESADHTRRVARLKELAARYEAELAEKRRRLKEVNNLLGGVALGEGDIQRKLAEAALEAGQKELLQVQSELRRARAELAALTEAGKRPEEAAVPEDALEDQIDKDPAVQQLRGQVSQTEDQIEQTRAVVAISGEQSPRVVALQQKLQSARQALEARRKELRPAVVKTIREHQQAAGRQVIANLQQRIGVLQRVEKELQDERERRQAEARRREQATQELASLRGEIIQLEETLRKITAEVASLEVKQPATPRIRLLEKAEASGGIRALSRFL
jgi:hypothetical protein